MTELDARIAAAVDAALPCECTMQGVHRERSRWHVHYCPAHHRDAVKAALAGRAHYHGTCADCSWQVYDHPGFDCGMGHHPHDFAFGCTDWAEREGTP